MIVSLKLISDTSYTERLNWSDLRFFSADFYIQHKGDENSKVHRDSLEKVVALIICKCDKVLFTAE
jgi:hypothetical protein